MEENENLYDKIKEIIGNVPDDLNILEDSIDVDLQAEYFEFSSKLSRKYDKKWALQQLGTLQNPYSSIGMKKNVLTRLATLENIEAYRAIETYMEHPDKELKQWGQLALQESKMHMKSHLLEENQILISTGLGGRDNRLRYFVVLVARNKIDINDLQVDILKKEFIYTIEKYDGIIEDFDYSGYLVAFMILLPIKHPVRNILSEGIDQCNQLGDFLEPDSIITNVRRISFDEVVEHLENNN
ncbi:MAG TPA: hypothetical protein VJ951_01095 [Bacteroidales bacterium]|nr:hypothetical protein [Bacteroidales bacterium]